MTNPSTKSDTISKRYHLENCFSLRRIPTTLKNWKFLFRKKKFTTLALIFRYHRSIKLYVVAVIFFCFVICTIKLFYSTFNHGKKFSISLILIILFIFFHSLLCCREKFVVPFFFYSTFLVLFIIVSEKYCGKWEQKEYFQLF